MTNTQFEKLMAICEAQLAELRAVRGSCERAEARASAPSDVTPGNAFAVLTEPDAPSAVAEAFEAEAREVRVTLPGVPVSSPAVRKHKRGGR